MEENKNELSVLGKFVTDELEDSIKEQEDISKSLVPVEYSETGVVKTDKKTVPVIVGNKKYELLPLEETKNNFYDRLVMGDKEVLNDDYVYKVNPVNSKIKLYSDFKIPDKIGDATIQDMQLVFANYHNSIVPYKEKKLTKETAPVPLIQNIKYRLLLAALSLFIAWFAIYARFATWHVLILAGMYSLVHLLNAATTAYYTHTRNFKVFSGVITNIYTKMNISPSLRRSYIQISNGKKFITFPYKLSKSNNFKTGTPVTIFIPNNAEIKEGEMGPTVDYLLGISFSIDIKSANKQGEYQDNRMKDTMAEDFFND